MATTLSEVFLQTIQVKDFLILSPKQFRAAPGLGITAVEIFSWNLCVSNESSKSAAGNEQIHIRKHYVLCTSKNFYSKLDVLMKAAVILAEK